METDLIVLFPRSSASEPETMLAMGPGEGILKRVEILCEPDGLAVPTKRQPAGSKNINGDGGNGVIRRNDLGADLGKAKRLALDEGRENPVKGDLRLIDEARVKDIVVSEGEISKVLRQVHREARR